ncbi:MAG: hypothetical protein SF066_08450 [Thermoanaerobaculia bacterium]|nr:hypothetical protein [Thermoanaerobaculia bacterium]
MKSRVWSLILLAAATAAGVASASGPMAYDARFWFDHSPGPTTAEIVAGDLGILDLDQDPKLLIVAYRHLTELGVGPASQPKLLAAFEVPFETPWSESGQQRWIAERRRLPGASERTWIVTDRAFERTEGTYTWKEYRPNCLASAFETAAQTLAERIASHGLESPAVQEWVAGQDQVFALCEEGETPPPELDETWPEWLRRDREYQIAAAHFYAFHHEEARRRFAAIGRDTSSPWSGLARYLVARTAMRAGDREGAKLAIAEVLADASLTELHPAARRLETLVAIRSQPALRRQELETLLLAPSFVDADPRELGQALTDFEWLATGRVDGAGLPVGDLDTWLTVMIGSSPVNEVPAELAPAPPAAPLAIGFYRKKRTLPWLVAALVTAQGGEAELPELLAAAAAVPDDSPAAVTVGFHRARLLLTRATPEADGDARELLDGLLRRPGLAPAVGNRLKFLRAGLAPTLDEFLRFSLVTPVEMGFDDGGSQLWPEEPAVPPPLVLTDEAIAHLNRSVPTRELARLAGVSELLPAEWRQRIGLAAWVGAILEKDAAVAAGLVPVLRPVVPPALAADLEAWLGAASGERDFLAHWTILRWPGLSPRIADDVGRRTPLDEMDSLRENGWCEKGGLYGPTELVPVRFLSAAVQQAAASDEPWPDLKATALEIGPRVITYAEAHGDDPRVPEALHRLVRFTRVGCAWGDEVGVVSKRAFDLLHRRYPRSEWAAKTPYWFKG